MAPRMIMRLQHDDVRGNLAGHARDLIGRAPDRDMQKPTTRSGAFDHRVAKPLQLPPRASRECVRHDPTCPDALCNAHPQGFGLYDVNDVKLRFVDRPY
jgi:hypothetical protein